ncbi:M1 family metallopeptidase [Phytomonospora endophytica]|uniref:Aminopeptidase N n=1 Tax=Phytomonospora endophytica TaxID=714109 RepID=A0A841FEJ8_9ACTN|nr:M1 family metallopeptidase [Phytomonospora endophytica]MBB6032268.1 aminopeptidase N [Phytomonospora endophytica]GIG68618.1 metallopeptidase [Phytomonospora endophytica]
MRARTTPLALTVALAVGLSACTSPEPPPSPPAPEPPSELSAGRSEPVTDPLYPQQGNPGIDVLHYGLALTYVPGDRVLNGLAELTIRPVHDAGELRLDLAAGLTVTESTVDGVAAPAAREGDDLVLTAAVVKDRDIVVTVAYNGVPAPVPAPARREDMAGGIGAQTGADGELWTFQEPFGAFTWYPVNDHPSDEALYDVTVTTPEGWTGVSTGVYQGTETDDGYTTTTWRSADPVASYVTTLAVDRFEMYEQRAGEVHYVSWVPSGFAAQWEPLFAELPELVAWLERRYGPYPFPNSGIVAVGGRSGMETQGTITLSAGLAGGNGDRRVILHELAHQWFGDSVSPRDWRDVWLNESVATYAEAMWAVDQGMLTEADAVAVWSGADQRMRDEYGPPGDYDPGAFASGNVYFCTALMLHGLRGEMGPEKFDAMLRDWVQKQRNTTQDRASFTAWVSEYAGEDMTAFIDAWLDSPTTPRA